MQQDYAFFLQAIKLLLPQISYNDDLFSFAFFYRETLLTNHKEDQEIVLQLIASYITEKNEKLTSYWMRPLKSQIVNID